MNDEYLKAYRKAYRKHQEALEAFRKSYGITPYGGDLRGRAAAYHQHCRDEEEKSRGEFSHAIHIEACVDAHYAMIEE